MKLPLTLPDILAITKGQLKEIDAESDLSALHLLNYLYFTQLTVRLKTVSLELYIEYLKYPHQVHIPEFETLTANALWRLNFGAPLVEVEERLDVLASDEVYALLQEAGEVFCSLPSYVRFIPVERDQRADVGPNIFLPADRYPEFLIGLVGPRVGEQQRVHWQYLYAEKVWAGKTVRDRLIENNDLLLEVA